MIKVQCCCLFDITQTGVTGHFKGNRLPFRDLAGQDIKSELTWNRSRNQQRNWETLTQLIGLRSQIAYATEPQRDGQGWHFEFATETPDAYGNVDDPTEILRNDCEGVPMLVSLDPGNIISAPLVTSGPDQNIWFRTVPINNEQG